MEFWDAPGIGRLQGSVYRIVAKKVNACHAGMGGLLTKGRIGGSYKDFCEAPNKGEDS